MKKTIQTKTCDTRWIICTIAIVCFSLTGRYSVSVATGQNLRFTLLPTTEAYQLEVLEGHAVATCQQFHVLGKPIATVGPAKRAGAVEIYDSITNQHLVTLISPDPFRLNDLFGIAVAASGDLIVVGAELGDISGNDSGSAYVYDLQVGGTTPLYELANPVPKFKDYFGRAVAIDANIVVVGAYGDNTNQFDAGSAYVFDLNSDDPESPLFTLNNPDQQDSAYFGGRVAVSGEIVVVGAASDDTGAKNAGSAYVYDLASSEPEEPIAFLRNPTPERHDRFGISVSISGDIIVVSASGEDQQAGAAYVFDLRAADIETPVYTLLNPEPNPEQEFGNSVAILENIIVVGTPGFSSGACYVYDLGNPDPETPIMRLDNPSPNPLDRFGFSVSVWGDTVVVGAPFDDTYGLNVGLAYSYDLHGKNPKIPTAILSHPSPPDVDLFGHGLSAWENIVAVGATGDDTVAPDAGRVYVFDTTSDEPEVPILLLDNPGGKEGGHFAREVAIWDNLVAVSDRSFNDGRVYIYDRNAKDPTTPSLIIDNPTPESSDIFGVSLSMHKNVLCVGDSHDNTGAEEAGSVYIYDLDSTTPDTPIFTLHNPMPAIQDRFGNAVANFGDFIVVGASGDDAGATNSGTAFVYDMNASDPESPILTLPNPSPASDELFGNSVSVSGNFVVVGCLADITNNSRFGAAYLYDLESVQPETPFRISNPEPDNNDEFGYSVAISGNRLLVGARRDDTTHNITGAAFLFDLSEIGPFGTPYVRIQSPTPSADDRFGEIVVISGNHLVIAAPNDDTRVLDAGAVYIFEMKAAACADGGSLLEGAGQIGDFNATCGSDNVSWAAHGASLFFQISDPVVQFELTATAPAGFGGSTISVDVEASKQNANGNLNLRALLFNFTTSGYVALPGVMPLTTADAVQNFELPTGSSPADFIEPETNEVRLLLQTIQTSGLPNVRTQLDEVLFNFE